MFSPLPQIHLLEAHRKKERQKHAIRHRGGFLAAALSYYGDVSPDQDLLQIQGRVLRLATASHFPKHPVCIYRHVTRRSRVVKMASFCVMHQNGYMNGTIFWYNFFFCFFFFFYVVIILFFLLFFWYG